jgi:hypothetical protein
MEHQLEDLKERSQGEIDQFVCDEVSYRCEDYDEAD